MSLRVFIWSLIMCTVSAISWSSDQIVEGLVVSALEQREDDEEAPFDIHSSNKIHNCGGKPSNVYRVYSEYDAVAQRRFLLALEAFKSRLPLAIITNGCEGRVLRVSTIRLSR